MPQIKLLNTGTNANDGTGDTARAGAKKINDNFNLVNRRSAFANGTLAKGVLGFPGDSMAGYSAGQTQYSPIATLRMLHHDFDLIIDERAHADDSDVQRPLGQRGYNFAKGSTRTSHLRDVQLPFIKAEPPEFLFLSTFQNDRFFAVGAADSSIAIVKDVIDQLLDLGITIIMAGIYPQNDIGAATENAFGKHYVESVMRNWADTRPGLHFVPILDILKNGNPTQEAQSVVNWYGPVGASGGASFDGIHMAPFGARRVSKAYADVFRKLVGRAKTPAYEAFEFDQARNKYANYLGSAGRLIGSGGKINGVTNANIPAGVELIYDTTKNYTVTPTLTGNPDWPFRLTFSGTPSANDTIAVRFTNNKQLVSQAMEIHARARWVAMNGMSGIGVGQGMVGLGPDVPIMPVANGVGGSGGAIYVVPSEVSEELTLRSGRATGFQNQYGSTFRLDVTTAVVKDIPVSGSLEIGRVGYFRSDNYL